MLLIKSIYNNMHEKNNITNTIVYVVAKSNEQ